MIALQERVHGTPPPNGWHLGKLSRVLMVRKGHKNKGMIEENLLSLSYGKIVKKDIGTTDGLLPESFETYQIVDPGNIIMRLTDLQNDKRSLRQGLVRQRGIITSAYDALEVNGAHEPRYWAYALLALDLAKYYYSLGGGVRQSIKFADFSNEWITYADLPTQKAIADFLDRETARIDQLIEKKQRMVSLLSSRWESLFHFGRRDASTEHIRFKFIATRSQRQIRLDGGDEFTPLGLYNRGRGYFKKDITPSQELGDSTFFLVREGDLILSGQFAWEGAVALADEDANGCVVSHRYPVYVGTRGVLTAYLYAYFRTADGQFMLDNCSRGAAGRNRPLNTNILEREKILLLPRRIQEKVARLVGQEQAVKKVVTTSLDRLREFRSALITAAVTGQIDVSTWGKKGMTERRFDQIEEATSA